MRKRAQMSGLGVKRGFHKQGSIGGGGGFQKGAQTAIQKKWTKLTFLLRTGSVSGPRHLVMFGKKGLPTVRRLTR